MTCFWHPGFRQAGHWHIVATHTADNGTCLLSSASSKYFWSTDTILVVDVCLLYIQDTPMLCVHNCCCRSTIQSEHPQELTRSVGFNQRCASQAARLMLGEVDAEIRSRSPQSVAISLLSCSTSSLNTKRSSGIRSSGTSARLDSATP